MTTKCFVYRLKYDYGGGLIFIPCGDLSFEESKKCIVRDRVDDWVYLGAFDFEFRFLETLEREIRDDIVCFTAYGWGYD